MNSALAALKAAVASYKAARTDALDAFKAAACIGPYLHAHTHLVSASDGRDAYIAPYLDAYFNAEAIAASRQEYSYLSTEGEGDARFKRAALATALAKLLDQGRP
jgi:hypothetical protein